MNASRSSPSAESIATERLILTAHRIEDFDDSHAMWSHPTVTRYIGGKPSSGEEVWARLLRYAGHWSLLGFGYWVIREKASGSFVGEVGFADFKREIEPPFTGKPEIGWALVPAAHGKGFATEAVRAALCWGDTRWAGSDTVCMISPENAASRRVAEKCDYKEVARTEYKGRPTIIFTRSGKPSADCAAVRAIGGK
jgi:RimJ/RimL family protein N-acetyltransferase